MHLIYPTLYRRQGGVKPGQLLYKPLDNYNIYIFLFLPHVHTLHVWPSHMHYITDQNVTIGLVEIHPLLDQLHGCICVIQAAWRHVYISAVVAGE